MSSLLISVGELEKELSLLEGILLNILIYENATTELIVNYRFKSSDDHDTSVIGGLAQTLNEFGGKVDTGNVRTIVLEDLKMLFSSLEDFIFLIVVDPSYDDSQFSNLLKLLLEVYKACLTQFNDDETIADEMVINSQLISTLISEEIGGEMTFGPQAKIYPYKLRELAERRALKLLGKPKLDTVNDEESVEKTVPKEDITGIAEDKRKNVAAMLEEGQILSSNKALYHLLNKFIQTFKDALQITLIRFNQDGTIQKTTAGRLEESIDNKMYEIILGNMSQIIGMLDKGEEFRTIDLDGKWVFFQYVDAHSFIYITVESEEVLGLIMPLIGRISTTISNLFPDPNR
ncbi:MAG: hypothetical protein GPJ54_13830 [Candidatus Heimdallarchaeota archaeon]|nr:hypothetical protein [Candidatus Heimdallarchaeota archaeon]